MTRRTDLTTLRKYFSWKSIWFQSSGYQGLVIRDLIINSFLTGIFRRLAIVSGHFYIRSTFFNINIIETEIFFLRRKKFGYNLFLNKSFCQNILALIDELRFFLFKDVSILPRRQKSLYKKKVLVTLEDLIKLCSRFSNSNINANSRKLRNSYCFSVLYAKSFLFYYVGLSFFYSRTFYLKGTSLLFIKPHFEYYPISSSIINFFLLYDKPSFFYDFLSIFFLRSLNNKNQIFCSYSNSNSSRTLFSKIKEKYNKYNTSRFRNKRSYVKFSLLSYFQGRTTNHSRLKFKELLSSFNIKTSFYIFSFRCRSVPFFLPTKNIFAGLYNNVCIKNKKTFRDVSTSVPVIKDYILYYFSIYLFFSANLLDYSQLKTWTYLFLNWEFFFLKSKQLSSIPNISSFRRMKSVLSFSRIKYVIKKDSWKRTFIFYYWLFKYIWLSFFNSIFLNSKITNLTSNICYSKVDFLFKTLNSMYYTAYILLKKKSAPFFFNPIYYRLISTINSLILSESFAPRTFLKHGIKYLIREIEHTLHSYTHSFFLFTPNVHYRSKPFIKNSKIICEFIRLKLISGVTVGRCFSLVRKWQVSQIAYKRKKVFIDIKNKLNKPDTYSRRLKYTLRGIRITCSGPPYKARRKMRKKYHLWLAKEFVTGPMPLQSFKFSIDFFQSAVRIKRATLGLKVWTLFEKLEDEVIW